VNDADAMRLAIDLARLGEGDVNPNPLVGAVVARDGRVVGRGWHRRFGDPHAEIFALEEAADEARGATLFVTLEPCCHHGKTPPCTDRIIGAGVARVVLAVRDPNPAVDGRGIDALREAGGGGGGGGGPVAVVGPLAHEAAKQNEIFLTFTKTGLPFVQLKTAISLDGRIATRAGDSRWISGSASRSEAHRLRRKFSSVLVGVGTVLADDPELSVRHVFGRNPTPIVLDPSGRIPEAARLLERDRRAIVATASMSTRKEQALAARGARVWRIPQRRGRLDLSALLRRLAEASVDSVLVEGGGETAASFLEAGLVDKVAAFVAPLLIGGREATPSLGGVGAERVADAWHLRDLTVSRLGDDLYVVGYVSRTRGRRPEEERSA
jgi:diaminohydroxyphosphoribosylaminopyrimidine deaminase/5-amino-6-(5-phosphoribosylamino)uracil reductase